MQRSGDEPVIVVSQPGRQRLRLVLDGELVLGRECEGLLLADSQVSRRHLQLLAIDGGVRCTDLGSTNGTFIDGKPMLDPTVLAVDSTVSIGTTTIRLDDRPTSPAPLGPGRSTSLNAVDLRQTSIDLVAEMVTEAEWKPRVDAGTVTILFSDIESHTELVSRMGDVAWFDVLEEHNQTFRDEIARAGGREIKAQGDGFMITFPSVRRALGFCSAVQRRLQTIEGPDGAGGVTVRIGLHTGEVITDASGDVFGRHVIKAARIANLAAGGQVLVSSTVREIASGDPEWSFGDPVAVELKGLDGAHAVHDFFWEK
ncbi:MAG: adenylate/guanylate cyclase domain-containing protein [Actinomycetia bacterium]|nr:adenylate/guanylate cyclase domain-containing protein [Actinomycetes bacterium]